MSPNAHRLFNTHRVCHTMRLFFSLPLLSVFASFSYCVYNTTCLDLTIKLGWRDLFSMLSLLLYSCYMVLFCVHACARTYARSFILFRALGSCVYGKHVNQLYCMGLVARSFFCLPLFVFSFRVFVIPYFHLDALLVRARVRCGTLMFCMCVDCLCFDGVLK